ncbi:MAG: hypothetical protein Q9N02_02715, partial [Ghiorsea sp.]|nr:hypothetical protein [Ghiorsea sp.]
MKITLISLSLCAAFFLGGCDDKPANTLVGSWKSDKSKTLASMHGMKGIPDESKTYFEKNFFGRLTITYTEKTYSAVLEGEKDIR